MYLCAVKDRTIELRPVAQFLCEYIRKWLLLQLIDYI